MVFFVQKHIRQKKQSSFEMCRDDSTENPGECDWAILRKWNDKLAALTHNGLGYKLLNAHLSFDLVFYAHCCSLSHLQMAVLGEKPL